MADFGDVGDVVSLPGQPFASRPAVLFGGAGKVAGGAGQIVQDDVGLHDGETGVAQGGDLAVAVDCEVFGLLLDTVFQVHRAEAERQA